MEVQAKTLVMMDRCLVRQLNVEAELTSSAPQNLEEPTTDTVLNKKKEKYTNYKYWPKHPKHRAIKTSLRIIKLKKKQC